MTTLTNWLRPKQNPNKVRFIAMMESGVLVDEQADVVQTQVIAQKAKASIRNREPVPINHQLEEDAPPVWKENAIAETGLANPPGTESRNVLEDAPNLHMGYTSGTVDSGSWQMDPKHYGMVALATSVLIFILLAWLTSLNLSDPVEVGNGNSGNQQSTGAQEGGENGHGFAGSGEGEVELETGEAGAGAAGAGGTEVPDGARPAGTVPAVNVASGDGGDSP